jgi:hypothetical protein
MWWVVEGGRSKSCPAHGADRRGSGGDVGGVGIGLELVRHTRVETELDRHAGFAETLGIRSSVNAIAISLIWPVT